ncbi:MAG: FAD-dependent monooxygenase [Myxococcales bacterium]|nr:FAD-dependent monooxygenase [Myxococcales bacterium]
MGIADVCQARAAPIEETCFYTASGWRLRCDLGTGQMVNLLPVAEDAISAVVYLSERAGPPPHQDALAMRGYLISACAQFPPEVLRLFHALSADDFVFSDAIAQIEVPHITAGRCALIGDAAHCPTFLSGMGSSLALQDAHVLAGCLARDGTDVAATLDTLERYAESVAPIARRYHDSVAHEPPAAGP